MSALAHLIARDSRSTSSSTSYSTSSSSATYCPTVASSSAYDYYEIAQLEELGKRGLAHERERKAKEEAYNAYMAGERERLRQDAYTAYIAAERQRQDVNREEAAKLAAARSARRAQIERQLKESEEAYATYIADKRAAIRASRRTELERQVKEREEAYAAYIAAERQRLREEVAREEAAKRAEYAQREAAVAKVNKAYRHAYKHQKVYFQNQLDDARDANDEAAFEKVQEEWLGAMDAQKKSFNRLKHHEATKPLTTASGANSASTRPITNKPLPAVPTSSRTTRTTASSSRRAAADQLLRYYDQQQAEYNSAIADIDRLMATTAISRSNEQRQAEYDATIANLDRLLARR